MLLIEATIKEYGYLPTKLGRGSHRKVLRQCDKCGRVDPVEYRKITEYCLNCSLSVNNNRTATSERLKKLWQNKDLRYTAHHPMKCDKQQWKEKLSRILMGHTRSAHLKFTHQYVESLVKESGYELLSVYVSALEPLIFRCPKGHVWKASWNRFQCGTRCGTCKEPKIQKDLANWVLSLGVKIIYNNRTIIKPKQLDIYVPDKKLAIEYCGLYWHSTKFRPSNYHVHKLHLCLRKEVRLITLFEDDWLNNRADCENRIKDALGLSDVDDTLKNNDLRWGFIKTGAKIMRPMYWYIKKSNPHKRISPEEFRQNILPKFKGDPSGSERQIAQGMGYYRIYDCGHQK